MKESKSNAEGSVLEESINGDKQQMWDSKRWLKAVKRRIKEERAKDRESSGN